MPNVRHHNAQERLLELVYGMPPASLTFPLRDLARDILVEGYSREELLTDLEDVREELRHRSRIEAREQLKQMGPLEDEAAARFYKAVEEVRRQQVEDREDAVMDVMDFVYGWSASHMKV